MTPSCLIGESYLGSAHQNDCKAGVNRLNRRFQGVPLGSHEPTDVVLGVGACIIPDTDNIKLFDSV